jgi:hypothetical protein
MTADGIAERLQLACTTFELAAARFGAHRAPLQKKITLSNVLDREPLPNGYCSSS